jgi:hypothetical protein
VWELLCSTVAIASPSAIVAKLADVNRFVALCCHGHRIVICHCCRVRKRESFYSVALPSAITTEPADTNRSVTSGCCLLSIHWCLSIDVRSSPFILVDASYFSNRMYVFFKIVYRFKKN